MREWLLPIAPIAAVMYFTVYPHQFGELVMWIGNFLH